MFLDLRRRQEESGEPVVSFAPKPATATSPPTAPASSRTLAAQTSGQMARSFNHRGDLLIADQFNNRVIEINQAGDIVCSP